jgi:hypothetical protein
MMLKNLKAKFDSFMQTVENVLFGTEEVTNTYCIPCT